MNSHTKHVKQADIDWKVLAGYRVWALTAFAILCAMVASSPRELKYDEGYHIGLAGLVIEDGWRNALTSEKNQSAAGPLYALVHILIHGVTEFAAPAIRWANVSLLVAIIAVTWASLRDRTPHALEASVSILGVAFLWPTAGLALTEIPALLPFTLFFSIMGLAFKSTNYRTTLLWACIAGVALGVAVLGRQTYLVVLPVLALCFGAYRQQRFAILCCGLVATVTCGWVFLLWKGLVPPSQQYTSGAIKVEHALLGLSYMGAASLIMNPSNLTKYLSALWVPTLCISIGAVVLFLQETSTPGAGLVGRFVPPPMIAYAAVVLKTVLVSIGMLWLLQAVRELYENRRNAENTFYTLNCLALAVAPAKVSHLFSSRYIVGGITAECQRTIDEFKPSFLHLIILALSTAAGAGSLLAYYKS